MSNETLTEQAVELLCRLIEVPRVSREETAAADLLQDYMEHDLGLDVKREGTSMSEFYRKQAEAFLKLKTATGMGFVTSADMLGVLNELRAQGIDITKYEFIAAFSSPHSLRYFEKLPPFVDIKHQQLGAMTAQRLLDRIHSFNKLLRTDIVIAPELVKLDKLG